MRIPAGVELEDDANTKDYVLKIHRNIYGQKQAGRVWNRYLVNKLVKELGFKQSKVDECVSTEGKHYTFFIPTTAYLLDQTRRK